jgi:aldose 1-epimerase
MRPWMFWLLIGMTVMNVAPRGLADDITVEDFSSIKLYKLRNSQGLEVHVTNFGAIISSLIVPDRQGKLGDIALGYNDVSSYLNAVDKPYFGAIVGRYGNRIAGGRFSIDGQAYQLATNNGPNALHGGVIGFDKVVWTAETYTENGERGVVLTYLAKDGEEGYPGNLQVNVTYRLTDANELIVDYLATTDQATPVNLTQHTYFNLKGEGEGDILDHHLMINAANYTPVDETLIPTGELAPVAGTPFDFTELKPMGRDIGADHEQLRFGGGFDHNWVLQSQPASEKLLRGRAASQLSGGAASAKNRLRLAAKVYEPTTGRELTVETSEPGIQFYCGNFLDGRLRGKSGKPYVHRGGFCLETQHYPDSPNQPNFPSTILRPGEVYRSQTVFTFSAR